MVDQNGWPVLLKWPRADGDSGAHLPSAKAAQIQVFVDFLRGNYKTRGGATQPFHLIFDARWGSVEIFKAIFDAGMYCTASIGGGAAPRKLREKLAKDLQKREWRVVYHPVTRSLYCVLRAKEKSTVAIMTNWSTANPEVVQHQRRRYPARSFSVRAPECQRSYNVLKSSVDQLNRGVLDYALGHRCVTMEITFTQFFFNLIVTMAHRYYLMDPRNDSKQLQFRLDVLRELSGELCPPPPPQEGEMCWPVTVSGETCKCQTKGCRSNTSTHCPSCKVYMCPSHLLEYHRNKK